jgi:hypothetical protein
VFRTPTADAMSTAQRAMARQSESPSTDEWHLHQGAAGNWYYWTPTAQRYIGPFPAQYDALGAMQDAQRRVRIEAADDRSPLFGRAPRTAPAQQGFKFNRGQKRR